MNKDVYEDSLTRIKKSKDTIDKATERIYADKADEDRESALSDMPQAKLPECMRYIDEDELLIEFARGTSKKATLTTYYLFYEFSQYVKYLGVTMDKAAANMVYGLVKEYVKAHNITKETARDRAKFITNFLYKQGVIPFIEQPEPDTFMKEDRIACFKLPKFIEDLEPYLQLNDIAAEDASEFNDILHDDLNEQCEWEELLSEKDLHKRIKYAKSYQERRYYQQLLGSRAKPGRRKRNKKKKK